MSSKPEPRGRAVPSLPAKPIGALATGLVMLWRDRFASLAAVVLVLMVIAALIGPALLHSAATGMNLRARIAPPFDLQRRLALILGGDSLGRGILPRIIVAAQNTMMIAASTVLLSLVIGNTLGLIAGYRGGIVGDLMMRLTDILRRGGCRADADHRPHPDHHRHAGFRHCDAGRRKPVLAGSGRSGARGHLGRHGGRGGQLLAQRLVAGLLAGPRDHAGTMSPNLLSNWLRVATDPVQRWRLEPKETRQCLMQPC